MACLLCAEGLCSGSGLPGRHSWLIHCVNVTEGGVSLQPDPVLVQESVYQERPEQHGLPASGPS